MLFSKDNLPKTLIAKGDKLFGKGIKNEWGEEASSWELDIDYGNYDEVLVLSDPSSADVREEEVARIELAELPGCCGVCVLTGLDVEKAFRHKGYAEFLMECALYWAAYEGYTLAISTTLVSPYTDAIGKALNASVVESFTNRRTHNSIKLWTKKLPKPIK